ncbi:MAG: GNAT family N-acetyltransferase [Rubrimonas sp.]|uniref:GNAT family N-acetyltransferase n=1 Tax=Rubrimonas sp. TaxID=2036015 RepID=UPI002FDCF905
MRLSPDGADWKALAALHEAAFRDEAAPCWSAEAIEAAARAPGGALFAQGAGAFALTRVAAGEGELLTLAVAPENRRRGLARLLLAETCAHARADGAQAMFLEVATSNAAARALYAGAGFAEVGLRRGYYRSACGARVDAAVLRLELSVAPFKSV